MYPRSRLDDQVDSVVLKGIYTELARQVHLQSFISMKSSNHHHHHEDTDEDIIDEDIIDEDIIDGADLKIQHPTDDSSHESLNSFL